jgi:hypothetical protein
MENARRFMRKRFHLAEAKLRCFIPTECNTVVFTSLLYFKKGEAYNTKNANPSP